jgi:hypothetical protein
LHSGIRIRIQPTKTNADQDPKHWSLVLVFILDESTLFVYLQRTKSGVKVSELGGMMSRGVEKEVNWGAVLEDWRTLGSGLVKSVVCKDTEQFL